MIRPNKRFRRRRIRSPKLLFTSCFKQEPTPALSLVNPGLKKAGSSYVGGVVAESVYRPHAQDQALLVFVKLTQHVFRCHVVRIIIRNALQTSNMPNRTNRRSANFADTFSNVVGHGKDLISVLIEQKMIITEVRSTHMPMKILSF